jgi:peptidoglycan/LPS O-acetylase OafA/YrhL
MKYRPEIDGLRAVAVLPVVAYHLNVGHLPGGFVGVDVFFVISGFLITGHLQADITAGRFSIIRFYERRLRRIGPALLCLLLVIGTLAAFTLLPTDLNAFGGSLLSALLSVSNFYFWTHTGYFAGNVFAEPLLHTWSLAVEEQYYLVFPVILYFASNLSRRGRDAILLGLLAASLAVSAVGAFTAPVATFYLPYARAWELLLGAILAFDVVPFSGGRIWREAAMFAGLGLIALSVLFIRVDMPFPGLLALPPCIGTALVLIGGGTSKTFGERLLSTPPLVFIGLISYSLYLWHWPVIVFNRFDPELIPGELPPRLVKVILLIVSLVLATLSWWFVERSFRNRARVSVPFLLWATGSSALVVAFAGTLFVAFDGFPNRFPPVVMKIASYLDYDTKPYYRDGVCFIMSKYHYEDFNRSQCLQRKPGNNYLLLGDSHAAEFWYGLNSELRGAHVLQATASGCLPLLGAKGERRCTLLMAYAYNYVLSTHGLTGILVSAHWRTEDLPQLARTMGWWKAHHLPVILVGPTPEYDINLPHLLASAIIDHDPELPQRHLVRSLAVLDQKMSDLAGQNGIPYVSVYRMLCDDAGCRETVSDGAPMAFDKAHLTKEGSLFAAKAMITAGVFR